MNTRAALRRNRLNLLIFSVSCLLGLAIACSGCGSVDQAAQLGAGGAPDGAGADAASAGRWGAAGASGGATPAAGGAAAGGGAAQGGGSPQGGGGGDAAGAEIDGGAPAWPTCPKVGALLIAVGGHCWECQGETDAGRVGGAVPGPCEIAESQQKGLGLSGRAFCVSQPYPASCY